MRAARAYPDTAQPTRELAVVLIITGVAIVIAALGIGYVVGRARRNPSASPDASSRMPSPSPAPVAVQETLRVRDAPPAAAPAILPSEADASTGDAMAAERARLLRSYEAEAATLRGELVARGAAIVQLDTFAVERRHLFDELAVSRGETARYRQLVIDLENDAPPPFFGIGAPDDLKLIVGVGPMLERMLQQLGVATYRQIARWSERDIDEFDAKLHEFPGRIRRDGWVTQARALHQSKYGEPVSLRERG
jgi:predicted flap endonuclease-1-like 5' DNA nuclease